MFGTVRCARHICGITQVRFSKLIQGHAFSWRHKLLAVERMKPCVSFSDTSGDRLRAWLGLSSDEFYTPRYIAILPMGLCFP